MQCCIRAGNVIPAFERNPPNATIQAGWRISEEREGYLECGRFEHGFPRVKCEACRHENPVAFRCKRRGFCPYVVS